jgi:hypothetical protein
MTGVIMRFLTNPGFREFQPPRGLSPPIVRYGLCCFFQSGRGHIAQPHLAIALNAVASSYADRQGETNIATKAMAAVDRLLVARKV